MREKKTNSQTTNPPIPMNTITDYLNLPFIEILKRLLKDAVKDCLAESEVLATLANASAKSKKRGPDGLYGGSNAFGNGGGNRQHPTRRGNDRSAGTSAVPALNN